MSTPAGGQDNAAARALIEEASQELTFFNFDLSYKLFGQALALAESPGSDHWLKASFGRALSAQHRTPATRGLLDEATAGYQSIIDQAPDSRFAPRAVLNLGRIAEIRDYLGDEIDLEAARERYRHVFETWPELDIADEAALFYAGTYFQDFANRDRVQRGLDFLETWITDRDDRLGASMAWEMMGEVRYHHLQDYAGLVRCFAKADELGLTDPNKAGVMYWLAGRVAENELNDLPTAIRFYKKIITDAPRSGRAFQAQLALEDLQKRRPDLAIVIPQVKLFLAKPEESVESAPAAGDGAEGAP